MKPPAHQVKIVVADDSALYRALFRNTLSHESYLVFVAKDGHEALALVTKHQPDVLITDWEMPDFTGIELCARVHSNAESYTHAILVTSHNDKEKIIKGLAAGADDYLTKPFHEGELLARVRVGVRLADLQREIRAKNRLLEELARTDALTGLPNRRALEDWASHAICGAQRHRFPFWVVMIDLDHFKSVNDKHGHEAGDSVLRQFANLLKSHTRSADMCARLGGEEFVLAVSHIDRQGIDTAVERLRYRLEAECFEWQGQHLNVTASFGIAGTDSASHDFRQLLRAADSALYMAKEHGRNCLEFAQQL
jgi:diguanylate cyclase (GGDEF)-like protein